MFGLDRSGSIFAPSKIRKPKSLVYFTTSRLTEHRVNTIPKMACDPEKLINVVFLRKSIYDYCDKDHSNRLIQDRLWNEMRVKFLNLNSSSRNSAKKFKIVLFSNRFLFISCIQILRFFFYCFRYLIKIAT